MRTNVDLRLSGALARLPKKPSAEALRTSLPLLADVDGAIEYGFRGGHQQLVRAVASTADEELLELLGDAVTTLTRALPPGLSFPMESGLDDRIPGPPLQLHVGHLLPLSDTSSSTASGLSALSRMVPPSIHKMRSQEDVGQLLWPAAPVMARWLASQPALVAGRRVLEIGAGMGLTGFAAGLIGAAAELAAGADRVHTRVAVTDFNAVVLHNLRYNASLNEPCLNAGHPSLSLLRALAADGAAGGETGAGGACSSKLPSAADPLFSVHKLDWSPPAYAPACLHEKRLEYRRRRLQRFDKRDGEDAVPEAAARLSADATESASSAESSAAVAAALRSSGAAGGDAADVDGEDASGATAASSSPPPSCPSGSPLPLTAAFDVVLGSDMVCCVEDAFCVAGTLVRHLARPKPVSDRDCSGSGSGQASGGVAYFLLPPPDVRWGIEAWEDALTEAGLVFEVQPVPQQFLEHPPPELAPKPKHAALHRLHLYSPPTVAAGAGFPDSACAPSPPSATATDSNSAAGGAEPELVVAGGYEARLRLFTVRWPSHD